VVLPACSGDDATPAPSTTAPAAEGADGEAAPPTTSAEACADLETQYLDAFFALGAGTPNDPEATTVQLPVEQLRTITRQADQAGCGDFFRVVCSAFAELEEQGLTAGDVEAPANC
jgi:hypothetical protein